MVPQWLNTVEKHLLLDSLSTRMLYYWRKTISTIYFLSYKFSQDHLELLFACKRGTNGFNNNLDLRTFIAALRRLLLRNSIVASKHTNCIMYENTDTNSIFSLKCSKYRTPISQVNVSEDAALEEELIGIPHLSPESPSPHKGAILTYIGGFIIQKLSKNVSCKICYTAMVSHRPSKDHELICIKDHGGSVHPSEDVLKILKTCEMVFKGIVNGDMVLRKLPTGQCRGLECDFHNGICFARPPFLPNHKGNNWPIYENSTTQIWTILHINGH